MFKSILLFTIGLVVGFLFGNFYHTYTHNSFWLTYQLLESEVIFGFAIKIALLILVVYIVVSNVWPNQTKKEQSAGKHKQYSTPRT